MSFPFAGGTPSIAFTDDIGAVTLNCVVPRLLNWTPDKDDIQDERVRKGSGIIDVFVYRSDYVAAFDFPNIPQASADLMLRLKSWLIRGGTITVNTNDSSSRSYTCTRRPGTTPNISYDPEMLEFTLHLEVKNAAAAFMLCTY